MKPPTKMYNVRSIPIIIYFILFTISGFAGLIYESIWSHYLKLFLGHAAYAQTLVLSIFMGGMAIGAWITSHFSIKWRHPLIIYAIVEVIIGVLAISFHDIFVNVTSFSYDYILPNLATSESSLFSHIGKWLIASFLIIPQSILLGMTFPLMTSGVIRKYPESPGGSIAILYFTNSIGAAVGILASGFWLIELFGLQGTIIIAGTINLFLGISVWILFKLNPGSPALPPSIKDNPKVVSNTKTLFLIAAFITGAASFIYEISWIRMLSLVLGSSTHSFELMLSSFITGLALGGLWIRKYIDKIKKPIKFSGYVQILMGLLALLTIPLYSLTFDWMSYFLSGLALTDTGYTFYSLSSHAIALFIMLPATFMAGMTLPLFTYSLFSNGNGEGSIGQIYAANTAGAIVGVLFTVHIGLPLLGLKNSIFLAALLDIALGFVLIRVCIGKGFKLKTAVLASTCIIFSIAIFNYNSFNLNNLASGVFRHGGSSVSEGTEFLFYKDGKTSSVALYKSTKNIITIANNGKPDASININPEKEPTKDEPTMILAGSLPLAYKTDAINIANIGLGSGLTTHTLLANKSIEKLDTIEIERAVVEAAKGFGKKVSRVYEDPRSKIHIEDAKTFFATKDQQYDIIISEPSNPWVSGVSSLFTKEFYSLVKNYLTEDGLFVQWMQLYEMQTPLVASVIKALSPNFDDFIIYNTINQDILIIAKKQGKLENPDFSNLFKGKMALELAQVGIKSDNDINLRLIGSKELIKTFFYGNTLRPNSDYYPLLDLFAPKARYLKSNASGLYNIPLSPFPLLEYFENNRPPIKKEATKTIGLTQAKRAKDSEIIFNTLTKKHSTNKLQPISKDHAHSLIIVNLVISQCAWRKADSSQWLESFHQLMEVTLPSISKNDAMQLFNDSKWNHCVGNIPDNISTWLSFYSSIANRDVEAISYIGLSLLRDEKKISSKIKQYILGTTMLSLLVKNQPKDAKNLWQKHAKELYGWKKIPDNIIYLDDGKLPAYIVLIVNRMKIMLRE